MTMDTLTGKKMTRVYNTCPRKSSLGMSGETNVATLEIFRRNRDTKHTGSNGKRRWRSYRRRFGLQKWRRETRWIGRLSWCLHCWPGRWVRWIHERWVVLLRGRNTEVLVKIVALSVLATCVGRQAAERRKVAFVWIV